jgi:hypothetical protein
VLPFYINWVDTGIFITNFCDFNFGIWATEAEILSAAAMLNTDIHIYCSPGNESKWLKYKFVILGEKPVTTKSIFLDNSKGNHFDYVHIFKIMLNP